MGVIQTLIGRGLGSLRPAVATIVSRLRFESNMTDDGAARSWTLQSGTGYNTGSPLQGSGSLDVPGSAGSGCFTFDTSGLTALGTVWAIDGIAKPDVVTGYKQLWTNGWPIQCGQDGDTLRLVLSRRNDLTGIFLDISTPSLLGAGSAYTFSYWRNGTTYGIDVNGITRVTTTSGSAPATSTYGSVYIGNSSDTASNFDGLLDAITVWGP